MSRITLDVSCPKCYEWDITFQFNEDEEIIKCECLKCGYKNSLDMFLYTIEDEE